MRAFRGEVALAHYPFSSGVGSKKRPVLVIQNDRDNHRRINTIVIQITSNLRRAGDPTHCLIEIGTPEGQDSGLLQDSLVVCGNLATIEFDLIERVIGQLPADAMARVEECLKVALGF
jgi:mRNA interferase MazF